MHNIGNDIVDLSLAKIQSNWQRKGFLEKQFTQKEQIEILASENPFLKVWLFWSMKEAAYKCYTQKNEKRFFAPKKFQCTLTSKEEGFVVFEDSKFYTATFFNAFYIHTIADEVKNGGKITSAICLPNTVNTVNTVIKKTLEKKTTFPFEEIEKRKTIVGAPLFYYKEKLLTNSCSISHHGNYAAYIFTLNNEY